MTLYQASNNQVFTITSTPDDDLLRALGVTKGKTLKVVHKQPFGGPVVIKIQKRDFALDKHIAMQIEVAVNL